MSDAQLLHPVPADDPAVCLPDACRMPVCYQPQPTKPCCVLARRACPLPAPPHAPCAATNAFVATYVLAFISAVFNLILAATLVTNRKSFGGSRLGEHRVSRGGRRGPSGGIVGRSMALVFKNLKV